MVSFENFAKSMSPSLSELKVIPSFCFAFKIPDDVTATTVCINTGKKINQQCLTVKIPSNNFDLIENLL